MFDFLSKKFSTIFSRLKGETCLTEKNIDDTLNQLNDTLLQADVPYDIVTSFINEVKEEVVGKNVRKSLKPSEQLIKIVYDKIVQFLTQKDITQNSFTFDIPSVVMVMGLQGSGKTTTLPKLANYVKQTALKRGKKRKILLASVDFNRPAAVDQLEILAKQIGTDFYRSSCKDPVLAAQDILNHFKQESYDILFLDTAGRFHIDNQLLEELKKIDGIVKPKYKILVIDSMTGQESLAVAQEFNNNIGFLGSILTKMDSDTRGGLAFAFRYALKKPILFLTEGEKVDDLECFRPERMASRIIGMGDLSSLVEKAEEKIKKEDEENLKKSISQNRMSLDDFAKQIEMINKVGSLSKLMKYIPGIGSYNVTNEMVEKGEQEIKKFKAIISSMTLKERLFPKIIDSSRKKRIANGSGVSVQDINSLLVRFEETKQIMKMFKKTNGRFF